ncbi:hypothetical protein DFR52_104404 [Hoeflea marina]|uniref:Uncharacterized protein n=1 Tax=Hoeflea marina TaxID=274592 RepID=A0A317PHQ2_9HYPH|nr:hypothetical protein [Hoeflea marina]PWV99112.1 hypothetical protein DFR52_104404 [Hoeflea marina]
MRDRKNLLTASILAVGIGGGAFGAAPAQADQVFADDVIIQGSLCVGFDCVNNETFGDTTILMKENNTRVRFFDTSVGTFPSTDWQLTANDSASGGANKFSIEDLTAATVPFTITGNAPSNSMFVDSVGRLGLKTSTPVLDLHIRSGNTPAMRMEQDGSSGFPAQTWDVAGNEANFFVRDVTNGSRLPFRIQPGAPTSSVYINNVGNVGLGAGTTPDTALHISRSDNAATTLTMENTNAAINRTWQLVLRTDGEFALNDAASVGADFIFRAGAAGGLTIQGNLVTGAGGTCAPPNPPCDLVFADPSKLPTIEEHARDMWANQYLPAVGPTLAGEPIDVTDKITRMLNELEKAHIYIAELHQRIADLEQDRPTASP